MKAFCFASGHIEFGLSLPDGALPIASGPAKVLRNYIEPHGRHGYRAKTINGRLTKIPGTDTLLVPGIPEAPDEFAAVDALRAWLDWVKQRAPKSLRSS